MTIKDLHKPFTLKVTKADIKRGDRGVGTSCPVHYAIERVFPNESNEVDYESICFYQILMRSIQNPKWLSKWIRNFDNVLCRKPVKPFSKRVRIDKAFKLKAYNG